MARVSYQPNSTYTFTSRFRFDNDDFRRRSGWSSRPRANFDRWTMSAALWRLCRPARSSASSTAARACSAPARVKLDANWVLLGGARYDINAGKFDQTRIGLGYIDDCLILALNYITNYTYGAATPVLDHTIMLQLSLRTLGGTSVSQGVSSVGGL